MKLTLPRTGRVWRSQTPRPWHWYAAGKLMAVHALVSLLGSAWALLTGQPWLLGVFLLLWVLAGWIYLEYRNAD